MESPRSAAAIVLIRENPGLEVFWVRRSPQMMFQGGFYAFPGGQLDPNEDVKVCAARELLEEVGTKVDPATLIDVGRWVTPAFAPRRFDTCFFLAKCPADQEARVASGEHDIGEWVQPRAAVAKWMEGQILMAPPVLHALRCLMHGLDGIEVMMKFVPWAHGEAFAEIELRPGIVLVPVRTPTLPPATHTNCYIVGGDEVVVIDPASPYEEEQAVLDGALEKRKVREIWLTHLHRDHVSGANHLKQRLGVKIAAHPVTARDLDGFVQVDRTFAEDERLELAGNPGWNLRVMHTPGHARGHVCIRTVVIDPPEGHMATYFDSLRRMHALPVSALFPAHGPVMANAKAKIQEYLDHRMNRERRILAAWQSGYRDSGSIVKEVYTDVAPTMHGLAERSVEAHLQKLREENKL
jgi:glyoxylase-like metal-dependent hydrolase (beta-lactamase superfamily II)/8-oxo-dGTP pyrophosphatase MutT (NUDIX family)